jgi:hypothetical protein
VQEAFCYPASSAPAQVPVGYYCPSKILPSMFRLPSCPDIDQLCSYRQDSCNCRMTVAASISQPCYTLPYCTSTFERRHPYLPAKRYHCGARSRDIEAIYLRLPVSTLCAIQTQPCTHTQSAMLPPDTHHLRRRFETSQYIVSACTYIVGNM